MATQIIQVYNRYFHLTAFACSGMTLALGAIILCAGAAVHSTLGIMIGLGVCGFCLNAAAIGSLVALSKPFFFPSYHPLSRHSLPFGRNIFIIISFPPKPANIPPFCD